MYVLINFIIESADIFPRDIILLIPLVIEQVPTRQADDKLNDYIKSFVQDLQLNINSFCSACMSYLLPKLNKLQKDRIVALMRISYKMTELNYFKQFETDEKE